MVSFKTFIIIFLLSIIVASLLLFQCKKKTEHFENNEYSNFYNLMTTSSIELEDRCLLARQKIQDKNDGLHINAQVLDAAGNFINDHCSGKPKKVELQPNININPTDKDALSKYYENYCLPKYGELRDSVSFDNYQVEKDGKGIHYFNNKPIHQLELTKENCRRLEEYTKNIKNDSNCEKSGLSIENLYENCLEKYSVQTEKVNPYNYYLSRDGKYYLNNEPLQRIHLNKNNCRIIQDVMDKNKAEQSGSLTITLDKLNEEQRRLLCKRSSELDLICSVYDKDKVMEYGKNHEKEPVLYQYEIAPEKNEYSFLTPTEHGHISKNINRGRSGLTADNEIDLCYRKHIIDKECNAARVRKDI